MNPELISESAVPGPIVGQSVTRVDIRAVSADTSQPNPVHPELTTEGNLIRLHQIRRGSVGTAWAEARVIVEREQRCSSHTLAWPRWAMSPA